MAEALADTMLAHKFMNELNHNQSLILKYLMQQG